MGYGLRDKHGGLALNGLGAMSWSRWFTPKRLGRARGSRGKGLPAVAFLVLLAILFLGAGVTAATAADRSVLEKSLAEVQRTGPTTVLRFGSRGEFVAILQRALALMGHSPGGIDGVFGRQTQGAVRAFQQSHGLAVDGVAGRETFKRLAAELEGLVVAARPAVHVVKEGEVLGDIARKYGLDTRLLARVNGIANPDVIFPGQRLQIPGPAQEVVAGNGQGQAVGQGNGPGNGQGGDPRKGTPRPAGKNGGATPAPGVSGQPSKPLATVAEGSGGRIALTFNDGPDPVLTPRILDLLDQFGAKATFFVVGEQAAANQSILIRMKSSGHQIENHSWSHRDLTALSRTDRTTEILRTRALIKGVTGRETGYFRPPMARFDAGLLEDIGATDHRVVLWSNIGPGDMPPVAGGATTLAGLERYLYDGSVIMLHDTVPATSAAMEKFLKTVQGGGFTLVTLTELLDGSKPGSQ